MPEPEAESTADSVPAVVGAYRVLARKYRPTTLGTLIGQDALVRTLSNALRSGRVAQAYMLAGVRGVGKTTTARIVARALNCTGREGDSIEPCGRCEHCVAIAEDRHLDVIELDAASRSKVDEMRELLDGVRYRPTSARYKVYIIDEVHMLSNHSFNALLKTLEEPPEHVKFIFATTEIRKVPVTVLSRCQRFDLRRVDQATLARHLAAIAAREGAAIDESALQLLARAADGSVRDGLSLLDQAITRAEAGIDEALVRDMLGLADRTVLFDLLDAALRGDAGLALDLLAAQHVHGADPATVIEDLLDLVHWLTRVKLAPDSAAGLGVPEAERMRGQAMANALTMAEVTRAWQLLLKGLGEVRLAPMPLAAAEMVLVRLVYAARLPTPAEALRSLGDSPEGGGGDGGGRGRAAIPLTAPSPAPPAPKAPPPPASTAAAQPTTKAPAAPPSAVAPSVPPPKTNPDAAVTALRGIVQSAASRSTPSAEATPVDSFEALVALTAQHREGILHGQLMADVRLVHFEVGRIELKLEERAPADLPQRLSRFLAATTGRQWLVAVSQQEGAAPLKAQREAAEAAFEATARQHPLVQAILQQFPGAIIDSVKRVAPTETTAPAIAAGESNEEDGESLEEGESVVDAENVDAMADTDNDHDKNDGQGEERWRSSGNENSW